MVWLLAGIQFMQILDFVLMMPLGPQLMRLFQLTPGDFGLLISVYMFAAAASGLVASTLVDRFDRRKVLLVLIGGFSAAALATAASPSYAALIVAHAAAGSCGGVLGMQVHAVIGDTIPDGRRGAATGVVMSAFAMASVAGVPIALVLADIGGWRAPFAVLAAGALVLLALTLRTLPPLAGHLHGRTAGHFLASTRAVFAEPNHRRAFLVVAFLMLAGFSVIPYSAPYFVKNVGLKESEISVLWFFGGLTTMFTSRWIGRQIDLRGKQRVFRVVALLSCAPILITTHLPPVPLSVAVLASVLFMTIVSGRFVPVMAMVNAAAQPRLRGSFLSVSGAVQQASAGCASFVGGLIIGYGPAGELTRYGWVGWFAVAMTLAAVAVARRVRSVS